MTAIDGTECRFDQKPERIKNLLERRVLMEEASTKVTKKAAVVGTDND